MSNAGAPRQQQTSQHLKKGVGVGVAGLAIVLSVAAACVPYDASYNARVGPAGVAPAPGQSQSQAASGVQAQTSVQSQAQAQAAANLPTEVTVKASEFKFQPNQFQLPAGKPVKITLDNVGAVEHDITMETAGFRVLSRAGQKQTGEFTFDRPGTYEYICSIPGHKEAGMKGTLTVVGAGPSAPAPGPAARDAYTSSDLLHAQGQQAAQETQAPPVPAEALPLPPVQVAPPVNRAQPATVRVDLETRKVTALMADGVAYEYWTFNGTVPGPMVRVRQGDTVEINIRNSPDAGVSHSIDLHAATGPGGGGKVTQVPPGESAMFRFQALNPGIYVYHCATPMVAHHIASGMYGLIVVEPPEGLPPVDHEFYVMQGDFYLHGARGDGGLRPFDMDKMLDERPDYVVFNGRQGALAGDSALRARVGETVRIFFGVGGPNITSSFHVIGEIFDRVFPEGALANPVTNVQTTHVPAGGATMVEFKVDYPGTYTLVDHSLGRLEKGAAGQLIVDGPADPKIFDPVQPGGGGGGGH